ncbi:2201_t:CDS:2, partial [Funneliformis mosseae]
KHDLPDFPRQAWNEFTYDELLNEIGVGGTAAIDIVLLALITLDRIFHNFRNLLAKFSDEASEDYQEFLLYLKTWLAQNSF